MANKIDDDMLDYVSILAKLELKDAEREQARADMERMLAYADTLNDLDTEGIEPLVQVTDKQNVFREDLVTNGDMREEMLKNAPASKKGKYMVPHTF